MIVRIARKILGLHNGVKIDDPIYFNSRESINSRHSNFLFFNKMLTEAKKSTKIIYDIIDESGLLGNDLSIIDVGCGYGSLLNFISDEYPKTTLLGTDFSESKIANCKKVYPHIDFRVHNLYESLDLKYDRILCTEVLEHLLYPNKALIKLIERLNNNGSLFITVPNGRLDTYNGHINFWSIESWNVFLKENVTNDYKIEASLFLKDKLIYTIITKQQG